MTPKTLSDLNKIFTFDRNHKMHKITKIGIGSLCTMIFGILFGWVIFPKVLHFMIAKQMSLAKGTDIRDMWTTVPFALDFKLYVFNCTNPDEVMKGGKPRVQEIGPYYYEEWKEKVNMEDLEDEDAIVYNRRDTFLFKKEKSGPGLTGDEIIIVPHPVIVTTAIYTAIEKPTMLNLVAKAINIIYDEPKSIFASIRVADLLFDGIAINCDQTEFSAKGVCTAMKKSKALEIFGKNQFKFSLLGKRNATIEEEKFKVLRGIRNIMDVGKVVEFAGKSSLDVWGGEECDNFSGTDGTVFPPFLTEKDQLISFSSEICRSLGAWYLKKSSYGGIKNNRYTVDFGNLSNESRNHCFCETPTSCPPKGLMDLNKCLSAPFTASLPHLYLVDPQVQASVQGLNPSAEKHEISIDFEPLSGTPLEAKKRLQFNIKLMKIDKIDIFKDLTTNQLVPLLWVEEALALNRTFIKMVDNQLFLPIRIVTIIKWLFFIGGMIGAVVSLGLRNKASIMKFTVAPSDNRQQPNGNTNNGIGNQQKLSISTIQNAIQNNEKF